jgi:hypothetical protein
VIIDGAYLKKVSCHPEVHVSNSFKRKGVKMKIEIVHKAQEDADFNTFKYMKRLQPIKYCLFKKASSTTVENSLGLRAGDRPRAKLEIKGRKSRGIRSN